MLRDVIRRLVTKGKNPRLYHVYFSHTGRRFVVWVLMGGLFLRKRIKTYFENRMGNKVTNISIEYKDGSPECLPDYMVIRIE